MAPRGKDAKRDPSQPVTSTREANTGFVLLEAIYTVGEFKRRLGWSDSTLRAARRRGLQVLRSGKRAYVTGSNFYEFLQREVGD